ncbi:hypothetical protein ISE67_16280 [Pseudomonas aeruginosa]|uniref:hypothetical protein n=1 Tax=Pseudomonas aeruginosa TaxID=287 RepID=UPI000D64B4AC|nr:hypothetical protein [Pseudomonas aeruginosa]MBA5137386.1 hypothetical protein [Pseudomonas aeruginosa]MBX6032259.1 hypothetical protein [Pseudomonas aeruginosa]RQA59566.1 hypothetical protein IPC476_15925 [Pseudomonas aeruginosa]RQA81183.1 hypothetical protein IPC477_16155 [Pseudomonas aeruginosa]RQA98201.1 hypothetical protein IPC475_03040 [Pseudomonas aeruginosa]
MKIVIDTPYVTVNEFIRRSGQSDKAVRREIEKGNYIIRPKADESLKTAVLINMIHLAMEAAEQAERVRAEKKAKPQTGQQ